MHIADVKVSNAWVTLKDLIPEVEPSATYIIMNTSPDIVYAVEGDVLPGETITGAPISSGSYGVYVQGEQEHLYLRNGFTPVTTSGINSYIKDSNISISKVG